MEFLLVSDIHADEYNKFATTDTQTGMNSRLFWTLDVFDQILEYGETHGCKTLLIGGDIFDKRGTIGVTTYNAVYDKLANLQASGWEVISIVGNHDQAMRSGKIHALRPMPMQVIDGAGLIELVHGGTVGCVSFCETPSEFLERLKLIAGRFSAPVYLVHQGVNGAKIAGDEILSRDETSLTAIRKIVGKDAWVFSGHYHIHQAVDPRFIYIGSSTPKDFGDKTPKGFLHFKNGELTQIESRAPKFIVVDAADLKKKTVKDGLQGNYVQIRYDDKEPQNVEELGAAGFVTVKKKVEREYTKRSSIDPEQSPLRVIRSYISDLKEAGQLPSDVSEKDLMAGLNEVLGHREVEQALGGHKIGIVSIELENFMSYQSQTIDMTDLRGMILIEGNNKDDPSATSNGSGKSVIAESVKWALFGSTARGWNGDKVVNRAAGKNCRVELVLTVDDQIVRVTRYRKHKEHKNQLFLEKADSSGQWCDLRGKSDSETQTKLCYELGTDENTFDNTVFFGHNFTQSFAALTDKDQKSVLETILGVEYFSELYEKAKALAAQVKAKTSQSEERMQWLRAQHTQAVKDYDVIEFNYQNFDTKKSEKINQQKTVIATHKNYLETMKSTAKEEAELAELKAQAASLTPPDDAAHDTLRTLQNTHRQLLNDMSSLTNRIDSAKTRIKTAESQMADCDTELDTLALRLEEAVCPTCSQAVHDESVFVPLVEKIENRKRQLQCDIDTATQTMLTAQKRNIELHAEETALSLTLERAMAAAESREKQLKDAHAVQTKISNLERTISEIQRSVASVRGQLSDAERWLKHFQDEQNPYAVQIEQLAEKADAIATELEALETEMAPLVSQLSVYSFWEAAFSDKGTLTQSPIKSYLFDAVVPVLDELARIYSEILTSGSMEVQFNTVTAIKSGELRDKFSVDVVNKYGADGYLGDSGGERRKADLVIMFALHSLARIRSGSQFNILFLDEILDSLDSEGCDRVMQLLSEISGDIEKIFVITHNENLKSKFATTVQVFKENGISSLEF